LEAARGKDNGFGPEEQEKKILQRKG